MSGAVYPISDEVADEIRALIIGDIHQLSTELADISKRIEALGPTIHDVDDKWLQSKKQALSAEFQEIVRQSLAEESRSALSETNRIVAKASDRLNVASTQLNHGYIQLLVMACVVGIATGIFSVIITWYLFLFQ